MAHTDRNAMRNEDGATVAECDSKQSTTVDDSVPACTVSLFSGKSQ